MGVSLLVSNKVSFPQAKVSFRDTSKVSAGGSISLFPPDTAVTYEFSSDINYRFADGSDYEFAG